MSRFDLALGVALFGFTARQVLVLRGVWRSHRFLSPGGAGGCQPVDVPERQPRFYVGLPVLREAPIITSTVDHVAGLLKGHEGAIVVVTTAREAAERSHRGEAADTVRVVEELARVGRCVHLHYPDPAGLKADQLNLAADYCRTLLGADVDPSRGFLVCYDADSRPPLDSLDRFAQAVAQHPEVEVFHQSSRFELREPPGAGGRRPASGLARVIADGGALRANRFVLGYEIPRLLNRSTFVGGLKRRLSSHVYAHVTGHGLCVRLSLLAALPFPARSPLEDMHYSFLLGSRNLPMLPVPGLDCAEVPASLRVQVEQAARWFVGPGRFRRYLHDQRTEPGLRARLLATSALAICLEWLSCAVLPVLLVVFLAVGGGFVRVAVALFVIVYTGQLVATEAYVGSPAPVGSRLARVLAYPVSCLLFGIGGVLGAARLLRGRSGAGKTERQPA
jgi:hypothetical protein